MIKNSLLVCASILFAVFLAEIGLRLGGIAYPEFNRLDRTLGWSPRPNTEGFHAIEGRTWMRINAAGFRDIDHKIEKPKNVYRIAILGDSFAEGREVPLEKVFWKIMEKRLQSCRTASIDKFEVLGFAVNGYGTAQQLIVLRNHVWRYQPDAILLAFFTGNDVWNNSADLDRHPDRPYYELKNGNLILKNEKLNSETFKSKKFLTDLKHGIYNQLRTLQVARQSYKIIRYSKKNQQLPLAEQLSAGLDNGIYRPPTSPAWQKAWAVTERLVKQINTDAQQRGKVSFWLSSLSTPAQVYPEAQVRRAFATELGVPNLAYPEIRLAEFAKSHNIPFFPLAHPLQEFAETQGIRLHGTQSFAGGHWNEIGHQQAGIRLAEHVCTALMRR